MPQQLTVDITKGIDMSPRLMIPRSHVGCESFGSVPGKDFILQFFLVGGHKHSAKYPLSWTDKIVHVCVFSKYMNKEALVRSCFKGKHIKGWRPSVTKSLLWFVFSALMYAEYCAQLFAHLPHWPECQKALTVWHYYWSTTHSNTRPSDVIAS